MSLLTLVLILALLSPDALQPAPPQPEPRKSPPAGNKSRSKPARTQRQAAETPGDRLARECNTGKVDSCFALAKLHETGDGVPQDHALAIELYGRVCARDLSFCERVATEAGLAQARSAALATTEDRATLLSVARTDADELVKKAARQRYALLDGADPAKDIEIEKSFSYERRRWTFTVKARNKSDRFAYSSLGLQIYWFSSPQPELRTLRGSLAPGATTEIILSNAGPSPFRKVSGSGPVMIIANEPQETMMSVGSVPDENFKPDIRTIVRIGTALAELDPSFSGLSSGP